MTAVHGSAEQADQKTRSPFDCGLEVATTGADTLRATLRVEGVLDDGTVALLLSILGTHVRFGRRYIRVDLGHAVTDVAAIGGLLANAHRTIVDLGGMLVFDNTDDRTVQGLRSFDLHASPAV